MPNSTLIKIKSKKRINFSSPTEFYLYQLALAHPSNRKKISRVKVIQPSRSQVKNQKNVKLSVSSLNEKDFHENSEQEKNWSNSFFTILFVTLFIRTTFFVILKTAFEIKCFLITSDFFSPSVRYIFRMLYRLNDWSYIIIITSGLSFNFLAKISENLSRNWENYLISTLLGIFFSGIYWYIGGIRGIVDAIIYIITQIYRIPGRFYNFVFGFLMSIIRLGTSIVNLFLNYEETYLFCLRICYFFLSFFIKLGKLGFNILIGIYLLVFLGCIIQLATMMPFTISSVFSYFSRVRIHWLCFTLFGITICIPTLTLAIKSDTSRKEKEKKTQKRGFLKIKIIPGLRILRDRFFKKRAKKEEFNEFSECGSS